jgi:hypothetical protein
MPTKELLHNTSVDGGWIVGDVDDMSRTAA